MRFLYKLNELFPNLNVSGSSTLRLKFIINKQLLSELNSLKLSLSGINIFKLYAWSQFLNQESNHVKYTKILNDYTKKY